MRAATAAGPPGTLSLRAWLVRIVVLIGLRALTPHAKTGGGETEMAITITFNDEQLSKLKGILRRECFAKYVLEHERQIAQELYSLVAADQAPPGCDSKF
jgi:hypothetical protein